MAEEATKQQQQQQAKADAPIPGPKPVGPEYLWEPDYDRPMGPTLQFGRWFMDLFRVPAHWLRENVIEPNRGPKYYWYHRKYPRALPIDECYLDDAVCIYEANLEYKRNRLIDVAALDLLRYRRDSCDFWNLTNKNILAPSENCKEITDTYNREELNFFIKYGDLQMLHSVMTVYNKQKHRMIMERRRAILKEKGELPEYQS